MIVVAVVIAIVVALAIIIVYNRLVRERQEVASAWHTVEAELARRSQLIPQLVVAVRSIATHERQLLQALEQQNQQAIEQGFAPPAVSSWGPPLTIAIHRVIALRERYPVLNSQQNYLRLQHELSITEDRIAAARRYYNLQVRQLNDMIGVFPSNIVAGFAKIQTAAYYTDPSYRGVNDSPPEPYDSASPPISANPPSPARPPGSAISPEQTSPTPGPRQFPPPRS